MHASILKLSLQKLLTGLHDWQGWYIFEPTGANGTVGSYTSLSVCLSLHQKSDWTKIHISGNIIDSHKTWYTGVPILDMGRPKRSGS